MEEEKKVDLERTLVLLKVDAVQRGLMGRIIQRFEDVGLKIVGMKMVWVDERLASEHYNDLGIRRGEETKKRVVSMLTQGPVVAMAIEGIEAVAEVRMMVGSTEPKAAQPGTIRGDFAHVSYGYADGHNIGIKNLIHASGTPEEAEREVMLWFNFDELYKYKSVHDAHILE